MVEDGVTSRARFTEQLVHLEEPQYAAAVDDLAGEHGRSRAEILRLTVRAGLPVVRRALAREAQDRAALASQ
jgi:hypothetical protein